MMHEDDHRQIGKRLDLFHMDEQAPGMAFWHPRGLAVLEALEQAVRREMQRQSIALVRSPQLWRSPAFEASGHWEHFYDGMFRVDDDVDAALKPVSCPAHLRFAARRGLSYRDLPYRIGEIGLVHRKEHSGALHGLFRLRQFSQDDGHILCEPGQVAGEISRFCERVRVFYEAFGLEAVSVGFSSRPAERMGDDAAWDRAEASLREAARDAGLELAEQPGEGAFYGPKLEFVLRDRLGRDWQCGTIQLDLVMPERFDVAYVDADGRRQRPMLLHRAVLGSLERFLGIVLEHHGGALPPWLAAEQVRVIPISDAELSYAARVAKCLAAEGLRVGMDARAESLGLRVRAAHEDAAPYAVVVGAREVESAQIAVRGREGRECFALSQGVAALRGRCAPPL
jgi:threonyl-tRNA synthetase